MSKTTHFIHRKLTKCLQWIHAIPFRKFLTFMGPGYMVAVGYMDPGNWATDFAAGSEFGYSLLFVIFFSNLMAIFLQYLCIKLGVVTKKDLAENCREQLHPVINFIFYILCELAIMATDLAEVIGTAIALKLLFGLPLPWGIVLTGLDVLIILMAFKAKYLRYFEFFIGALVLTVAISFALLIGKVNPNWTDVAYGYLPIITIFKDENALYLAMGIVGATVMPHNLYLHSNMVKYRSSRKENMFGKIILEDEIDKENDEKNSNENNEIISAADEARKVKSMIRFMNCDSLIAMWLALLINSAILITAGATFYQKGDKDVGDLELAHRLLVQYLGPSAGVIFAIALFCSGQSSTITGTLAGQIVMQGFLGKGFNMPPWARRLVTRVVAIVPALAISLAVGDKGVSKLLVLSQVILSLQLPFAVWPLVLFTSRKDIMTIHPSFETSMSSDQELLEAVIDQESASTNDGINLNAQLSKSDTAHHNHATIKPSTNRTINDFSNGWPLKIVMYGIALLISGLNVYLLTQVRSAFENGSH